MNASTPQPVMQNETGRPVDIWPVLGLRAIEAGIGDAWRVWTLLRSLDPQGSGIVRQQDAVALSRQLRITPRRWARWIKAAQTAEVIRAFDRRWDGATETVYQLLGVQKLAVLLNAPSIGIRRVTVDMALLTDRKYRSFVFGAYLKTLNPTKPVSRKTIRRQTNIPESTQLYYERNLDIAYKKNFSVLEGSDAWMLPGAQAAGMAAFAYTDHDTNQTSIAVRLPDSREVLTSGIEASGVLSHRAKFINKALHHLQSGSVSSSSVARDLDAGNGRTAQRVSFAIPVFYNNPADLEGAEQQAKFLADKGYAAALPDNVFVRQASSSSVNIYVRRAAPGTVAASRMIGEGK